VIRIELDSIPEGSSHLDLLEEASDLEIAGDSGITSFESPLRLALHAMRSASEIVLRGTAGVDVVFECARCLERYKTRLEAGLNILCLFGEAAGEEVDGCREGVIEIPSNTRFIDISGEVRSELMVHLPVKPLCDKACKGLCPMCGANLNQTTCSCRSRGHDSRWDALKKLK
jgi:uncharacterized protein